VRASNAAIVGVLRLPALLLSSTFQMPPAIGLLLAALARRLLGRLALG
jgi:hypothetical protein